MMPFRNLKRFFQKTLKQPGYALRVFIRRLKANFGYIWSKGRSSYPEAITLFLTHRCNLRCKMCGQWGTEGITKKQSIQYIKEELSGEELKAIVDDLSGFKPNITLFGGEPLLHPGCIEIIRHIKQKGTHCLMITNGFLLKSLAEEVVLSGLDELNVSLDGDAQLHDEIRGMPGLFNTIMSGLKEIQHFKAKYTRKKPLVNLQCTITKYNYTKLETLIGVAKEAKADSLTFHNLIFLKTHSIERQKEYDQLLDCSSLDWQGFVFEPGIDVEALYKKISQIRSQKYSFNLDFYPNFSYSELVDYYQKPDSGLYGRACRCLSPWMVAYIFPDGEVRPCLNSTYSFGNIKKDKFAGIWNSKKAIIFRKALKKNHYFPACIRCTELYRY